MIFMKRFLAARNISGKGPYAFDVPRVCPLCGVTMDATTMTVLYSQGRYTGSPNVTATFQCVACDHFFHIDMDDSGTQVIYPRKPYFDLDENIKSNYLEFSKIYLQALRAESENLYHISGIAFRKSVERLVKDYLIKKNPKEEDKILNESLGQSINRIPNQRIKPLAKAATWIGNDHTHLVQKHPDYDVASMKKFVKALTYFILQEETIDDALNLTNQQPA